MIRKNNKFLLDVGYKENELGAKHGLMQMMLSPEEAAALKATKEAAENAVEKRGNTDAKLLAKAFEEYSANGITPSERETIEKLDNILDGADIVINPVGDKAAIAQNDGQAFNLKGKPLGKSR